MDANKARELMKKEEESKHETELRLIKESKGELEGFFKVRNYKKRMKKLERLISKEVREGKNRVQ